MRETTAAANGGVLDVRSENGAARVILARPKVRNAFNAELIAELAAAFRRLSADDEVRAIVLSGDGPTFCGGADVNWMRQSLELDEAANILDAERMSLMYRTIDRCAKPVIARIHGAALGGGAGLAAVCDIAIAARETVFGFTETKLGILPAVISPFVVRKIGLSNARALFLTGERFSAERAKEIGLVHRVVPEHELDSIVDHVLVELGSASPSAIAAAKATLARIAEATYDDSLPISVTAIAKQRVSEEGQEGLRAFLERRKPNWAP